MNLRLLSAVAAALALPHFSIAQKTNTLPNSQLAPGEKGPKKQPQKTKWDDMDLGPFFSGCYKVGDSISFKGIAVAVGTKDAPATMLFDSELLRFHAAWEGGLAKFPRVRGGLEGQIAADGDVKVSAGWRTGWGTAIKDDPREKHQGNLPGTKWHGIYVHGDANVLSYSVGKQAILEIPGSEVRDGVRIFTRTITVGAGSEARRLLVADAPGAAHSASKGIVATEKGGVVTAAALRSAQGVSIVSDANGCFVVDLPALAAETTFQVAFGSAPVADAGKLTSALQATTKLVLPATFTKAGPARWGAALDVPGKPGDSSQPYTVDDITLPEDNPFKSWMRPGGHDFLPDGTAVLANMSGDVWLVSGLDEKLEHVKWKRFATGLFQPLGCKVVDGKIYVLGRDRITLLHDLNGDGEADFYESFNSDSVVTENYHEFALGLETDSAGNFYYAKGSPWTPTNQSPHQGTMLKVSKDGSKLEVFATGLRAPNGLGMGPGDVLTCSDNQGHWMPANRVNIVKQGGFYGMTPAAHRELVFKRADGTEFKANPSLQSARDEFKTEFWGKAETPIPANGNDLPLFWLPMDIDNSSGGEVWVPQGAKWGPWAGRMLQTTYGKCALFGVTMETVDGVQQGGVVRFPLTFKSGIMRERFSPVDGQLYLSGLNVWQSSAAKDGCFQRVRYTGKPVTMPIGYVTKANGVEIEFTAPLDDASAGDAANWSAQQWNYSWTGNYGSPDFSVQDPKKRGKDTVEVKKATVSADKKRVLLELSDRVPAMTLRIKCNVKSADGTEVKYQLDNTIHRIPGQKTVAR